MGPTMAAQGGSNRKLIHDGRILGTAQEWSGTWGWIVPLQKISHPQFKSKLYCHRKDVQVPGGVLTSGATVDFLLYSDSRGLGAGDVRLAEAGASEYAGLGVVDARATGEGGEALPHGWEKIWSDEHGEYYYWNKTTKESSWVPPAAVEAPADPDDDALPEGWTMNFDPENNEYYYWHAPTKTTTWERPKATPKAADPAEGAEEPAGDAEADVRPAAEGPVLGQQRVKGRVEKWQGFFGWIAPTEELGDDLKPLLENRQDRIYCNWRDVREGTTIKAGSLVDFLLYADDNGLGATDVRLQKDAEKEDAKKAAPVPARGNRRQAPARDAMADLERQWAAEDAALASTLGNSAEDEAAAQPTGLGVQDAMETDDAPLLPGWEQQWSEEHNCYYYWHKVAKQASWDRPCLPVAPGERREDKVWEGEGLEEGAARLATPITPVAAGTADGREITPLTPATAADRQAAAKPAGRQPSAGFRAAQASGAFLGRGWTPNQPAPATGGKGAPVRAAPKPGAARALGPQAVGKGGKPAWVPAVKRPRVQ